MHPEKLADFEWLTTEGYEKRASHKADASLIITLAIKFQFAQIDILLIIFSITLHNFLEFFKMEITFKIIRCM